MTKFAAFLHVSLSLFSWAQITSFCFIPFSQAIVEEGNSVGVLPCLIENKHNADMDLKCAAAIEHWQLVCDVNICLITY